MGGRKRARSVTPAPYRSRGTYHALNARAPMTRTVTNSREVPQFSSTKMTNVVSHREYIGDLYTGGVAVVPMPTAQDFLQAL